MRRKQNLLVLTLVALVALVAGCGQPAATPAAKPADTKPAVTTPASAAPTPAAKPAEPVKKDPIKMTVGVSGTSINYIQFEIAYRKGFFKDEGLDINRIQVEGGTPMMQAMLAGQVPIGISSSQESVNSRISGSDLLIAATFVPNAPHLLITKPEIKTGAQLKGKKVGISSIGAISHAGARDAVATLGLDPEKDVTYIPTGGQTKRAQTLLAGSIDATVVSPPGTGMLLREGYNLMVDLMKAKVATAHENVIVSEKYLKENPEAVRRFMKGLARGIHLFRTNKAESEKIIFDYLKLDPVKDKQDVEDAWKFYVESNSPEVPYPALAGIKYQLQDIAKTRKDPKIADMDPKQFANSTFVKELDDSGWIKNLYK